MKFDSSNIRNWIWIIITGSVILVGCVTTYTTIGLNKAGITKGVEKADGMQARHADDVTALRQELTDLENEFIKFNTKLDLTYDTMLDMKMELRDIRNHLMGDE